MGTNCASGQCGSIASSTAAVWHKSPPDDDAYGRTLLHPKSSTWGRTPSTNCIEAFEPRSAKLKSSNSIADESGCTQRRWSRDQDYQPQRNAKNTKGTGAPSRFWFCALCVLSRPSHLVLWPNCLFYVQSASRKWRSSMVRLWANFSSPRTSSARNFFFFCNARIFSSMLSFMRSR